MSKKGAFQLLGEVDGRTTEGIDGGEDTDFLMEGLIFTGQFEISR